MQANCIVEIVPPKSLQSTVSPAAVTAEIRWSGDKQTTAHAVQRAWEHVRSHADTSGLNGQSSSVDDVHFQDALLASSPLFISISAPEVLADISRVQQHCSRLQCLLPMPYHIHLRSQLFPIFANARCGPILPSGSMA